MDIAIRILVALPGVLFLVNGIQWIFAPAAVAKSLGMPLLEGTARSTQIGDLGAFFLAGSAMILIGAATKERTWLLAAALLIGGAAVVRTLAWALQGAPFAAQFIVPEVVMTAILLFGAWRFGQERAAA